MWNKDVSSQLFGDLEATATASGLNPREALAVIEIAHANGMNPKATLEAGKAALDANGHRCNSCDAVMPITAITNAQENSPPPTNAAPRKAEADVDVPAWTQG